MFTYPVAYEDNRLPFVVALFYPHLGITASFYTNGESQGGIVQGCLQQNPAGNLLLRAPNSNLTFDEAIGTASEFNRDWRPLQDVTEMDVATFYETFKNSDNITCLETPANLWP
jgi:hypothetical protein